MDAELSAGARQDPGTQHHVQAVPIMEAFGLAVAWTGPGEASVRMPVPADAIAGRTHPLASLAVLIADTVCGNALVSAGHPRPALTVSLHVDLVGPVPRTGSLRGRARLALPAGQGPLYVTGTVEDDAGATVAHCTSWWLPGRGGSVGAPPTARAGSVPAPATAATLAERFGLQSVRHDGRARVTVACTAPYVNRRGTLHGGVLGLLGELAAEEALAGIDDPPGRTLSVTVDYLAPTGHSGSAVAIEATVVRAGRQIAVVESRILTATDEIAALVTIVRSR